MIITSTYAQKDKEKLEKEEQKLAKEINYTRKLLNQTSSERKESLNNISLLNSQIKSRKQLINNYSAQIKILEDKIIENKTQVSILKSELTDLKKEYAALIEQSYKSRNKLDKWVFIIASDDFYQAYRRVKYLQNHNDYRRKKAEMIEQKTKELTTLISDLEDARDEHLKVLVLKENETKNISKDLQQKTVVADKLRKEISGLRSKLAQQERERQRLQKKIEEIIQAAIDDNGGTVEEHRLKLTKEDKLIGKSFVSNKGKLPWPVERGKIVKWFGKHKHAELDIYVVNNGIGILTEKDSYVRVVFDGVVVNIVNAPRGKAILVRHGEYFTLYNHLSEVYVSEGDKLTTKQRIGKIYNGNNNDDPLLDFQIWSTNKKPQNPIYWISR